jgi:signal transduction histidine kinase
MARRPSARARRSPADLPVKTAGTAKRTSAAVPDDRFFRHIVRSLRNGVVAIHRDGTLALMNDDASRILQLPRDAGDIGRPAADVLRPRPDLVRVLSAAFEMTTLPTRAELRLKELDRVIGYTLSRVKNDAGHTVGAILLFKDLTRVEQAEERERLRDRLASLGEMAAGIAHELKNPLAGIEVMAGLLRRQVAGSPDAVSLLADIISEAKLANAIVVEMLEFVRPIRLQVGPASVREILHQSITLAENKVPRRDTAVEMDLAEDVTIDADHNQLCQVFSNLLTNAFEALDGQGRIDIRAGIHLAEPDPAFAGDLSAGVTENLIVDVSDSGPGVPQALNDRIFDPFFTTKTQGSGLGLPIVRKIVDAHDGRIDLTSTPGQGTSFRVTLPVGGPSRISGWYR